MTEPIAMRTSIRISISFFLLIAVGVFAQRVVFYSQNAPAGTVANIALDGTKHCVQDNNTTSSTTAGCTLTSVTAGDLITCSFTHEDTAGTVSVSDATNGAYTIAFDLDNITGAQTLGMAYFENSAAATVTPTLTISSAQQFSAISCEAWTGARSSLALDTGTVTKIRNTSGTNPNAGTSAVPTNGNELVYGAVTDSHAPTAGTNFVLIDSAANTVMYPEYWIQTTATSTNCPFTATTNTWWGAFCAAFLRSDAAAGTAVQQGDFVNFSGLTNGVAPTPTTLANSTFGVMSGTWDVVNTNSALFGDSSGGPTSALGTAIWTNGSSFTGSGGLNLRYATGAGDNFIRYTLASATACCTTMWQAYQFQTDLPQNDTTGNWYDMPAMYDATTGGDLVAFSLHANGTKLYGYAECVSASGGTAYSCTGACNEGDAGTIDIATSTQYAVVQKKVTNNPAGTVNTQNAATGGCAGNCATWVSGPTFPASLKQIKIASTVYAVSSRQSSTVITLGSAPGTQTGAVDSFVGSCTTETGCNVIHLYNSANSELAGSPLGCYTGTGTHMADTITVGVGGAEPQSSGHSIWWRNVQFGPVQLNP